MSLRTQVEARLVGFDRLDASSQAETLKQIEAQLRQALSGPDAAAAARTSPHPTVRTVRGTGE